MAVKRRCAECPPQTQAVCRHRFAVYWNDKSNGGEGCDFPLDDVAEAWRKAGWLAAEGKPTPSKRPLPQRRRQKMLDLVEKFRKGIGK